MSISHHVQGPAAIYAYSASLSLGTTSAPALLGVSTDGVGLEFIHYVDPIHDDRAGPNVSSDEQRFGTEARITADIISYDEAVRSELFAIADNGTLSTEGTEGYAGILFGLGNYYYTLIIQEPSGSSPTSESLWNFQNVRLLDAAAVKVGTVRNVWRCVWKAVNYLGTNLTLNTSVLYKRSFP